MVAELLFFYRSISNITLDRQQILLSFSLNTCCLKCSLSVTLRAKYYGLFISKSSTDDFGVHSNTFHTKQIILTNHRRPFLKYFLLKFHGHFLLSKWGSTITSLWPKDANFSCQMKIKTSWVIEKSFSYSNLTSYNAQFHYRKNYSAFVLTR